MYINIKYHLHLFTILSKEKKYGLVWFFISTQTKTTKIREFQRRETGKLTDLSQVTQSRKFNQTEPGINYPCIKGTVFTCYKQENSFL